MSTIKVTNIEHENTANGGIQLDNAGHVTVDGQQLPTAGQLSHRNLIINGAAEVNQRGTVTGGSGSQPFGGPDRFEKYISATSYEAQRSQQLDGPANTGFQRCYEWKTTTARTGSTADQYIAFGHTLEFQDIYNALWGGNSHVTMSFWVKSSITGTYAFNLNPANTDSGLNGDRVLHHSTYTINSANTWEKKTITIPLAGLTDNHNILSTSSSAQIARGLELTWVLGISSGGTRTTASTGWSTTEGRNIACSFSSNTGFFSTVGATFRITGIQFEVGEKATPFEHRTYGDELDRCKRYYQRYTNTTAAAFATGINGIFNSDTQCCHAFTFQKTMRASPSFSISQKSDFDLEPFDEEPATTPSLFGTPSTNIAVIRCDSPTTRTRGFASMLTLDQADAFFAFAAEV